MTPFKKMLITTDGSDKSGPAVAYGLGLAKLTGAEVTAMCVIDETDYQDMLNTAVPEVESVLYQQCANAVEAVVIKGKGTGIKVRPLVVGGIPSSEIIQASVGYDLTIMGTKGRTGLQHFVLGSVAEKVVRSAHSPVLVVHSGVTVPDGGPTVRKLLIPTDGTDSTKPAIERGLAMAKLYGAEVTAICVVDQSISEASAKIATDAVIKSAAILGVPAISKILAGSPSEEIVNASSDFDLIVMGTVGRTGLAHTRLGSVAERTVRQAKCPVLVVHA